MYQSPGGALSHPGIVWATISMAKTGLFHLALLLCELLSLWPRQVQPWHSFYVWATISMTRQVHLPLALFLFVRYYLYGPDRSLPALFQCVRYYLYDQTGPSHPSTLSTCELLSLWPRQVHPWHSFYVWGTISMAKTGPSLHSFYVWATISMAKTGPAIVSVVCVFAKKSPM
jgi:hypothetical protein